MAATKPFWAEGPIPPALLDTYFVGRTEEVARLSNRWAQRAPARTVLLAPERAGKRSLLAATLRDTKGAVAPLHVRIDRLLPENGDGLAAALLEALALRAPSPVLTRLERHLRHGPPERAAEVIRQLDGPLDGLDRRPLVLLEGAESLARLPPEVLAALDDLVGTTRAHFVATMAHLPAGLQEAVPRLLGPAGVRVTRLTPLARREAQEYVRARLAAVRCQPTAGALDLLLDYAGGDPASLQLLGARSHEVLLRSGRGRLQEEDVGEGLYMALESLPPDWTRILGELKGRSRDCFVALALLEDPTVSEVGERIRLDAKNVSVILSRLVERGAPVEKVARGRFRITHRLLAEWVRKEWQRVG